jgi:hypothetical protein
MNQEKNTNVSHNDNKNQIMIINSLDNYEKGELKFSTNNIYD